MDHPLQFSLSVLQDKGKARFEGTVQPEALESPLTDQVSLAGPATVEVAAEWREQRVWLKGRATGEWTLECSRCLARKTSSYVVRIDAVLEEPPAVIDALEETRQTLILAVPTQPYCREDCRGLCPKCGSNRNEKECGCDMTPPSRFKITKRGKTDA